MLRAVWSTDGHRIWIYRRLLSVDRSGFVQALKGAVTPGSPVEAGLTPEEQVLVYDVERDSGTVVWRAPSTEAHVEGLAPLGSHRALVLVTELKPDQPRRQTLLRLSARGERAAVVASFEDSTTVSLLAHTDASVAVPKVALVELGPVHRVLLASWSGVQPSVEVPGVVSSKFSRGAFWVLTGAEGRWLRVDPATGVATEQAPPKDDEEELPLAWETVSPAKGQGARPARLLWIGLQSGPDDAAGRFLLSADADEVAAVAPDRSAVAYVVDGVALVRELYPAPVETLQRLKREAAEAVALSRAKQVGLAMMMYAADYGGVLPQDAADIAPYLRNRDYLDGFVFTARGLSVRNIADPGGTEIGYFPFEGGQRIVVFADGSAKKRP